MPTVAAIGLDVPDTWKLASLADVTSKIGSGATPRGGSTVYVDAGTALIRSQNVYDNRFSYDGLVFINDAAAEKLRGVTVEVGDVLLNITGDSILRTCVVPPDILPARVSQHVAIVRSNGRLEPLFLQKWLTLPVVKNHMLGHSSGGTRKAITKGHIESFPVPVPPMLEQQGIAATLRAVDEKIESNARVLMKLQDLGQALYRSAVGEQSRDASIAELAEFHNRRRVPLSSHERDARPGDIPYYGATGVFGYVEDFLFDEILVLVGEDGSVVNADGTPFVQYIWGKSWINNHAHALKGRGISNELLFFALRQSDVRPLVTGAVQPKLSMGNLGALVVRVPNDAVRDGLELALTELMSVYRARSDENRSLVQLREVLLPELLSGRIRVPESEGGAI